MRVALTKGTLLVSPTYFALSRAPTMPKLDQRTFTLVVRTTGPTVTVPIDETAPRASGSPLLLRVIAQARGMGQTRHAITTWNPDVIHQHQAIWPLSAVGAARETGVPLVMTFYDGNAYPRLGRGAGAAWNARDRTSAFEGASWLLTVPRYLTDVILGAEADPERLNVHYQGVDMHWWTSASDTAESREEPVVLFVGALSRLKGADDLARASASLAGRRSRRLILVGDGPLAPAPRAYVPAHVTFTGRLDREGVCGWVCHTRVLVLPTKPTQRRQGAAGLMLFEAQACDVLVIAYRTGGTPEIIVPGAPILSDEHSPDALARSIDEVLA